ncbi:MAG TPA: hypothetical protein ENK91_05975, partial [Bacteroidetes bacterium]|nr:hypothetical protein [Bacteroidota bacterium]
MNFIEELRWRGMLQDMTPGTEELLQSKKVIGYIGFDPTAPSLTIGNLVQIMILKLFQKHGNKPIHNEANTTTSTAETKLGNNRSAVD